VDAVAGEQDSDGHRVVAGQDGERGEPVGELLTAAAAPLADADPLCELAQGDEREYRSTSD
jgi:hypothetical protein